MKKVRSSAAHTRPDTYFQILHEVVKDTKAFRIFAVLNIDERPDFGSLDITRQAKTSCPSPTV